MMPDVQAPYGASIMAAEGIERMSATDDTLADASRDEEVCDEWTAIRASGKVQRQTGAGGTMDSLSLSEHTCSVHFDRSLKVNSYLSRHESLHGRWLY